MTHQERIVYGGVDTHEDVHVAAVIDATGRLLGTKAYPTTPIGLRGMLRWMTGQGTVAKVGVEGTGTYGLGLQRVLQHAGLTVIEVNRPNRQLRQTRGKSDTVDAEAAARGPRARLGLGRHRPPGWCQTTWLDSTSGARRIGPGSQRNPRPLGSRVRRRWHSRKSWAPASGQGDGVPGHSDGRRCQGGGCGATGHGAVGD